MIDHVFKALMHGCSNHQIQFYSPSFPVGSHLVSLSDDRPLEATVILSATTLTCHCLHSTIEMASNLVTWTYNLHPFQATLYGT